MICESSSSFYFREAGKSWNWVQTNFAAAAQSSVVCIQSFYTFFSIRTKNIPTLFSPFPILSVSALCQNFLNGANALLLLLFITFKKLWHSLSFCVLLACENPLFVSAFGRPSAIINERRKKNHLNFSTTSTCRRAQHSTPHNFAFFPFCLTYFSSLQLWKFRNPIRFN